MKKRFVAFALFISTAVLSVTTGCMVQQRHGDGGRHHDRYHNGNGYNNNDHGHDHDHDNRGY